MFRQLIDENIDRGTIPNSDNLVSIIFINSLNVRVILVIDFLFLVFYSCLCIASLLLFCSLLFYDDSQFTLRLLLLYHLRL